MNDSYSIELVAVLEELSRSTGADLSKLEERLSNLGIDTPTEIRRPGVTCPITEVAIVAPCQLSACPLHIENSWNRNCMLDYLESQGGEALSEEEIAFIYHDSPKRVKDTIDKGIVGLRSNLSKTMGISKTVSRTKTPKISANVNEDDDFEISASTVAPALLGNSNKVLERLVPADLVFKHPAVRLLGVLDSIISDLQP